MGRSSRLAVGAIAAAVAAGQIATSHLGAAIALALAGILLVHEVRPELRARTLVPVAIGAALIAIRLTVMQPAATPLVAPPDGKGPWTMTVEATGSPRDGRQVATLVSAPAAGVAFSVAATLPRYPAIVPGDQVVVEGAIRPRPDSPYGEYLERIGAIGTLESRTLTVASVPDDPGRRLEGLRRGAGDALTTVLPEPEAGLAAGILIGLRDRVDRDLAAAFTTAGVSHVVAISGWNIAIVAAAIAAVTGRLGRRRRSIVTILAIVAYVAFAGASASVVRAALMAGVVLLARESGRAGRATAALGWAATLLLVSDPALIGDAGFQLSSLATAGLIAWATALTDWFGTLGGGRVPRWLAEALGVSPPAKAATLPIVLVSFGRLAILSPLVNLVVVPLVAPAMAVGVVALGGGAMVAGGGPAVIGAVLAAPGWVVLRILVTVVETAARLPFASVTLVPPFDLIMAVAATAGIGAVVWWTRRDATKTAAPNLPEPAHPTTSRVAHPHDRVRRASIAALLISLVVAGGVVAARPSGTPTISVLDVGQGDAILVEGSRGGRLLIDGGPDPDRLLVALGARIPPWDRRIDAVILSHPHEDHVAGLALLLERYHVARVFEPGMRGPGPGYAAWLRDLARPGAPVRLGLAAGDHLAVDEIDFQVLWPVRGRVPATPPDGGTGINNVSVVLLGRIGDRRALLMGDVEEGIDPSLLADGLPHVDLLKVAHHGSRTATTQAFVDATRPTVAVASAGAGNPYGHPAKATLDRLAASGARVLRTDRDGTVVVSFEPGAMTVRTEGAAATTSPPTAQLASATASSFLCAVPVTGLLPVARPTRPPNRPVKATGETERSAPPPLPAETRPTCCLTTIPSTASRRSRRPDRRRRPSGRIPSDDDGPTGVLLGRRRAVSSPRGRPVRGDDGGRGRCTDGAVVAARQPERGLVASRRAPGPSRDAGDVRRRDAGCHREARRARPQDRGP